MRKVLRIAGKYIAALVVIFIAVALVLGVFALFCWGTSTASDYVDSHYGRVAALATFLGCLGLLVAAIIAAMWVLTSEAEDK